MPGATPAHQGHGERWTPRGALLLVALLSAALWLLLSAVFADLLG